MRDVCLIVDSQYDWAFTTTPQKHSNNRVMTWNRGKGLGKTAPDNAFERIFTHNVHDKGEALPRTS